MARNRVRNAEISILTRETVKTLKNDPFWGPKTDRFWTPIVSKN